MKRIHLAGFALLLFFVFPALSQAKVYCPIALSSSYTAKYVDIDPNSDLCVAMKYVFNRGIMSQFGVTSTYDGYMRAGDYTNRAQAISVVLNAFDPDVANVDTSNPPNGSQLGFLDTPSYDRQWWYAAALRGIQLGFIRGYADGYFRGGNNVTRAEFAKMFLSASPSKSVVDGFDVSGHKDVYNDLVGNPYEWYSKYVAFIGFYPQMRQAFVSRCPARNFCPSLAMTTNEMALFMYYYHLWSGNNIGGYKKLNPNPPPVPNPPYNPYTPTIEAPVLASPANGTQYDLNQISGSTNVNFNWYVAAGATKYDLMMRKEGSGYLFFHTTGNSNTVRFSDFPASNQNYTGYWKVRAYDASGNYKDSNEWYFTVINNNVSLAKPVLASPINGSTYVGSNPDVDFKWWPTKGATRYQLMVLYGGNSSYNYYDVPGVVYYDSLDSTGVPLSYFISASNFPALTQNYTHHWKIRAFGASGNYWDSDEWVFYVNKQGGGSGGTSVPVLSLPANGTQYDASPRTVNFQWTGNAAYYRFKLHLSGNSTYLVDQVIYAKNYSYIFTSILGNSNYAGKTYYWTVVAYDSSGNPVPAGNEFYFSFQAADVLSAPVLTSPDDQANFTYNPFLRTLVRFSWEAATGATSYVLYMNDGVKTVSYPATTDTFFTWSMGSDLSPIAQIKNPVLWWVRAYDADGNYKESFSRRFNIGQKKSGL